ncbi:MAG: phospholipase D-like domain-containing protein [Pirellulaceae bacterium]|nr:phospholipase D-like domain-containing protein [Pirellulaceae bacterium]
MQKQQIDDLLKRTLDDFRVSRGEKRILEGMVQEHGDSEQQLGFLRHRAFAVARESIVGPEGIAAMEWLEDVIKVFQPREEPEQNSTQVYFSPGDDCPQIIVNQLERAGRSIDICVFTITDNRIADAIRDAFVRGIAVRVISDNDKSLDPGSDIERLMGLGVPVRIDQTDHHMHHKYAVFDQKTTLTGSYNWTRSADKHNDENFLITGEASINRAYLGHFDRLWDALG